MVTDQQCATVELVRGGIDADMHQHFHTVIGLDTYGMFRRQESHDFPIHGGTQHALLRHNRHALTQQSL